MTLHRVILSADSGHWEDGGFLGSERLNALHLFRVQEPLCCAMLDTDQSQATERVSELLERPSSCPGKCQSTLSFSEPQVAYDPEMTVAVAERATSPMPRV